MRNNSTSEIFLASSLQSTKAVRVTLQWTSVDEKNHDQQNISGTRTAAQQGPRTALTTEQNPTRKNSTSKIYFEWNLQPERLISPHRLQPLVAQHHTRSHPLSDGAPCLENCSVRSPRFSLQQDARETKTHYLERPRGEQRVSID